eukprot:31032-Pelagococcus_subviridis.AAC.13
MEVQVSSAERLRDGGFHPRHARRAADGLDDFDVAQCQVEVREEVHDRLKRRGRAVPQAFLLRELVERRPGDRGAEVHVLVHPFHAQRRLLVRAENFLRLPNLLAELRDRFRGVARLHAHLRVLRVELVQEVIDEE